MPSRRLGRALTDLLASYGRSNLFISTKASTVRGGLFDRRGTDFSADYLEAARAKALSNLGLDFVDIFYLHGISSSLTALTLATG
jgi:1-deoxyxylulose-5-phosphate synthase